MQCTPQNLKIINLVIPKFLFVTDVCVVIIIRTKRACQPQLALVREMSMGVASSNSASGKCPLAFLPHGVTINRLKWTQNNGNHQTDGQ